MSSRLENKTTTNCDRLTKEPKRLFFAIFEIPKRIRKDVFCTNCTIRNTPASSDQMTSYVFIDFDCEVNILSISDRLFINNKK